MPNTNNFSNYLEDKLRGHMLRGQTFLPSGAVNVPLAIALCSGYPVDASTGASCLEIQNANAYVRQSYVSSTANWSADDTVNGAAANNTLITFPPCTTVDWGWISGLVITDTNVYGAGNVYFWGQLITPKYIGVGDTFTVPVTGITITLD